MSKKESEFVEQVKEFNRNIQSNKLAILIPVWHIKCFCFIIRFAFYSDEKAVEVLKKKMEKAKKTKIIIGAPGTGKRKVYTPSLNGEDTNEEK